ncbi:MAG: peptidoglycan editing factor PgeF [Rubricoccaceae bacterium]|nr:peptidoglycan editing factor PgeF [Rubricoccaceae bacterium]
MILRPTIFDRESHVIAGFTTRLYSPGNGVAVEQIADGLAKDFGFAEVASAEQVHGNVVEGVDEPGHFSGCDGLVSNEKDLLLTVRAADCALVLLADTANNVIGACHAGWRGTVGHIATRTVLKMETLGGVASKIKAYITPCISLENFEVGEEVAERFPDGFVHRRETWLRPHVDMRGTIAAQLVDAGLPFDSIEIAQGCTVADRTHFYSYRAENGTQGRMIGFIGLRVD